MLFAMCIKPNRLTLLSRTSYIPTSNRSALFSSFYLHSHVSIILSFYNAYCIPYIKVFVRKKKQKTYARSKAFELRSAFVLCAFKVHGRASYYPFEEFL